MVGCDHVRSVGVSPADEARAEPGVRLDGEDAEQDAFREWRDPCIPLLERPLGAADARGEGRVVELERLQPAVQ
jgi:hypothetical protein